MRNKMSESKLERLAAILQDQFLATFYDCTKKSNGKIFNLITDS